MIKKLQKNDYLFIIALLAGLVLHMLCIFSADHFTDESCYASIALRLISGDSLVQHEWNVTQFASLFLYFPVQIWLALTGSANGIILFLRFLYLPIHTFATIGIYAYFRKYKHWAVISSFLFYTQIPAIRFFALSYNTIFALGLLALTITFLNIYDNKANVFTFVLSGICYGCCCVCNPLFCILFPIYIVFCIAKPLHSRLYKRANTTETTGRNQRTNAQFFNFKSSLLFTLGVVFVAIISIIFFFACGGTLSGIIENFSNLLTDSQHSLDDSIHILIINKIKTSLFTIGQTKIFSVFLLPFLYLAIRLDKKRRNLKHIAFYISSSLIISITIMLGICSTIGNIYSFVITPPLTIISSVCYVFTENKNHKLFRCMWIPGIIATIIQYFASGVDLTSCWVLVISNIAGVFFIMDFYNEIRKVDANKENTPGNFKVICKRAICIAICLQICFQFFMYSTGKIVNPQEDNRVTTGPYAGLYLKDRYYNHYVSSLNDLDILKERSNDDDNVLIVSQFSWLNLYIDRPFAGYSVYTDFLDISRLKSYYNNNPDKKPKYIYLSCHYICTTTTRCNIFLEYKDYNSYTQKKINDLSEMFSFTQEELSCGILLTVQE